MLAVGDRVGRWRVEEPLHWAGPFDAFRAIDDLNNVVILKVVGQAAPEDVRARAEREIATLGRLDHPTLPRLLDVDTDEARGFRWFAIEHIEGETLADRIAEGGLPLDEVREIFAEVADGLRHAHRAGVVHRDVRPGTIVLTDFGPRLAELGIARLREDTRLTTAFGREGALAYLPPEYFGAERVRDFAPADIYALGVTLWETLTLERAFPDPDGPPVQRIQQLSESKLAARALDPGNRFPPGLRGLVRRATAPSRDDRLIDLERFRDWEPGDRRDLDAKLPPVWPPDRSPTGEPAPVQVGVPRRRDEIGPWLALFLVGVVVAAALTLGLVYGVI